MRGFHVVYVSRVVFCERCVYWYVGVSRVVVVWWFSFVIGIGVVFSW